MYVVARGEGDPGQGQQHPQEQVRSAWPKVAPLPNIISLPGCNLDKFNLFHREEEGLAVR